MLGAQKASNSVYVADVTLEELDSTDLASGAKTTPVHQLGLSSSSYQRLLGSFEFVLKRTSKAGTNVILKLDSHVEPANLGPVYAPWRFFRSFGVRLEETRPITCDPRQQYYNVNQDFVVKLLDAKWWCLQLQCALSRVHFWGRYFLAGDVISLFLSHQHASIRTHPPGLVYVNLLQGHMVVPLRPGQTLQLITAKHELIECCAPGGVSSKHYPIGDWQSNEFTLSKTPPIPTCILVGGRVSSTVKTVNLPTMNADGPVVVGAERDLVLLTTNLTGFYIRKRRPEVPKIHRGCPVKLCYHAETVDYWESKFQITKPVDFVRLDCYSWGSIISNL